MQRTQILEKVTKLVIEHLGVDEAKVTEDSHLSDTLGADSLDSVELIMAIEDEFDIEIPDEEAENMTTVGIIVESIMSKLTA